jgi:hypothetical protein
MLTLSRLRSIRKDQVVPKIWTGVESRVAYLRRLSVVFALDLRIKIVTELYLREMSPKQFYAEFGGGSLSRVDKNFKKLAEHGWLRYVRSEGPGGSRRGAHEHFYRATDLAVFDNETWALVPYSMRVAISWRTFKILAERVRDALTAGTLDARAGSHLNRTTIALDQCGWERVVAAVDAVFASLFEEQDDAKLRISHSGEEPMVATVALAAFESPASSQGRPAERTTPHLVQVHKDSPIPFMLRVSKAFADELCLKIVAEANLREISAPLFHAEFEGDSIEAIRRRFKKLESVGWLKQVSQKTGGRRRSAVELFYRATGPAILDNERWAEAPDLVDSTRSWTTFTALAEQVKEAILAGTFEAHLDNHLSWSVLRLDRVGWEKVTSSLDALRALILKEGGAAETRIARSGERPIFTTVGLAAFESPREPVKEP